MGTEYAEHLETIRNLIVAGWMLLALGWAVQLGFDAREDQSKPKGKWDAATYCQLGKQQMATCPHCIAKKGRPDD